MDDDDDTQSFYSLAPWEEGDTEDADWSKAAAVHAQSNGLPVLAAQTTTAWCQSFRRAADEQTASSVATDEAASIPTAVPAIAEHRHDPLNQARRDAQRHLAHHPSDTLKEQVRTRPSTQRPSTSGGEHRSTRSHAAARADVGLEVRTTRSKTLSAHPDPAHQHALSKLEGAFKAGRMDPGRSADLFLELAKDQTALGDKARPTSHDEPLQGHRLSLANKRRSLPPAAHGMPSSADTRPTSSGQIFGRVPVPRIDHASALQHHLDRYSSTSMRAIPQAEDLASVSSRSRSSAPRRSFNTAERTGLPNDQLRSPEMPHYGRRRPSFGAPPRQIHKSHTMYLSKQLQDSYGQSPAEDSEPKRSIPDSASVDSDTADTVWDELDDLKSRIKRLELTGKLPPTSGASLSAEQSDRPRTATTAPTTIDSSPKHDKAEVQETKIDLEVQSTFPDAPAEYIVGGPDAANIHPNLHAALTKAKSLLNPSLYRSLEATAADALQLAAMTGSAGPQGTALTAAAIINGVAVSDRHVRRKADTMCRNLTDLVLALCDGKIETASSSSSIPMASSSSPVIISTPTTLRSPSLRYSRSSLDPSDSLVRNRTRPMSRLEARRTSMLGSQTGGSSINGGGGNSPLESGEDVSASEYEPTALRSRQQRESFGQVRAVSRLQAVRARHFDEAEGRGEDEDPTIRPVSRAATDVSRVNPLGGRKEYSTPPQKSPGFREAIAARRSSHEGGGHRELARVASLVSDSGGGGRRWFLDANNTPPVVEEEGGGREDYSQSLSAAKRRVTSFAGPYASRRSVAGEGALSRTTSLSQRRQAMVG